MKSQRAGDGGFGFGVAIARLLRLPAESVYSKALTLFVGLSLLLGAAVVLLTSEIILREFEQTETQEMIGTLQRFTIVLSRETRPVQISLNEWMGRKLRDAGSATNAMEHLELDCISIADADGRIKSEIFRTENVRQFFENSLPWTDWIKRSGSPALSPRAGFILVGTHLAALAWHPMEDGTRIAAIRIFDQEPTAFLEGMFAARMEFEPLGKNGEPRDANDPLVSMLAKNEFYVAPTGPNELAGHVIVRGIDGAPIGQIRLLQPRPLYREGLQAVQIFLTIMTLAGGALFLVVWFLLDRTILKRIRSLTRMVERESVSGGLPLRLDFDGIDELAVLARRIEDLAVRLDRAQTNYRAVVEDQTEIICRFTPALGVLFANTVFLRLFPCEPTSSFLKACLPEATFASLESHFVELTPLKPVETFVHQLLRSGDQAIWLRSTLRASFDATGRCTGGQWVASDISPQIRAQQRLQESERRLRSLSSRLLRLQDDERRKIARELHDSTAQSLSALEMNMSLLEPVVGDSNMQRIVAETRQIARDCCLELRNISYLLHPPLLDEVGLPFALQWFVDGFQKRSSIEVSLDIDPDFPRMEADRETTIFRILQEAMSNIYRHSGASKAWITLKLDGNMIHLEVRDNGTGLQKAGGADEGVGFAGIRERLAHLDGRMEVHSSPYGVRLSVHLSKSNEHVRTEN